MIFGPGATRSDFFYEGDEMKKILIESATILGLLLLLVVVVVGVWMYYRGNQALEIADARGITFWQFIRERWQSWREVNTLVSAKPQYSGCRNNIIHFLWINFRSAYNYTVACLKPDSKLAEAFHYWEVHKPDPILPKAEAIQWFQAPDAFWNYFSRAYWRGLVSIDSQAGECQLGSVDFAAIFGGEL